MRLPTHGLVQKYEKARLTFNQARSGSKLRVNTRQGSFIGFCLAVSGKGLGRNALLLAVEKHTTVFRRVFLHNPDTSIEEIQYHGFRKSKLYYLLESRKAKILNKLLG